MIIDSHAYCWTAFDEETEGYSSAGEKMAWLMHSYSGHHQPALRLDDGAVGDASVLVGGATKSAAGVPTAGTLSHNFRLDKAAGRAVWDVPGEGSYSKYFCPPNLKGMEYTAESLDSEMHYAGVDAVLLHTDPMMVRASEPLRRLCAAHPGRFFAMAPVDEWRIIEEGEAIIATLRVAVLDHRLHAIKFIPPLCHVNGDLTPWDDVRIYARCTASVPAAATAAVPAVPNVPPLCLVFLHCSSTVPAVLCMLRAVSLTATGWDTGAVSTILAGRG